MSVAMTGVAIDLRFRGGASEGFRLDRGDDSDVRGAEGGGHVVLVADDAYALIEPGRTDLRHERRFVGVCAAVHRRRG